MIINFFFIKIDEITEIFSSLNIFSATIKPVGQFCQVKLNSISFFLQINVNFSRTHFVSTEEAENRFDTKVINLKQRKINFAVSWTWVNVVCSLLLITRERECLVERKCRWKNTFKIKSSHSRMLLNFSCITFKVVFTYTTSNRMIFFNLIFFYYKPQY